MMSVTGLDRLQTYATILAFPNLELYMCLPQMYSVIAEQRAGEGNQMLLAGGSDIDMDRYL